MISVNTDAMHSYPVARRCAMLCIIVCVYRASASVICVSVSFDSTLLSSTLLSVDLRVVLCVFMPCLLR